MKTTIKIQNLKCGGCANTITSKLKQIETVSNISVDVDNSAVTFEYDSEEVLLRAKEVLHKAGYPEEGTTNTIGSQAKSYVSCAIGKLS
ncbi:MAG: heavy-metal-associated domain-containing protein [Flavobacterium sp.]|nr:heavy-metal-associated domain-containing protein [Flavobacterium sp.]